MFIKFYLFSFLPLTLFPSTLFYDPNIALVVVRELNRSRTVRHLCFASPWYSCMHHIISLFPVFLLTFIKFSVISRWSTTTVILFSFLTPCLFPNGHTTTRSDFHSCSTCTSSSSCVESITFTAYSILKLLPVASIKLSLGSNFYFLFIFIKAPLYIITLVVPKLMLATTQSIKNGKLLRVCLVTPKKELIAYSW